LKFTLNENNDIILDINYEKETNEKQVWCKLRTFSK
jgi:hypothetical protein